MGSAVPKAETLKILGWPATTSCSWRAVCRELSYGDCPDVSW